MPKDEIRPYKYVSQIYSHLMRSIKYDRWAEYIYNLTFRHIPAEARILELAGGNGNLSYNLQKHYNNIIVSDISYEMLLDSQLKGLNNVCCDMKCLPFKSEFDMIFCAFDSVNYLTSKKALSEFFSEVRSLMGPESIFTFDASLELNSIKHEKYLNRSGVCGKYKFIQRNKYNAEKRIHINDFRIILENGEIIHEIHRQKIYPIEVFFDLLDLNGLFAKQCLNGFSFDDADEKSERVQFVVCRKNNVRI